MDVPVRASFWRGGTSRGVLFAQSDLQGFDERQQEAIILAAVGSPDPYGREIDGLGGGISSLSKAAIVGRAAPGSGADVIFHFAQVDVETPRAEFSGNCGNLSGAVGPYAIEQGLVAASDAEASITVLSVNTNQRFVAHVPLRDGRYDPAGDFRIDGVPGSGARIGLEYLDPGGSAGRGLLPTGRVRETARLRDGREVAVSIVDAGNPAVLVRATDLGASATEDPAALDADASLCATLEEIRALAAVRMDLAATVAEASLRAKAVPKVVMVASATAYRASDGGSVAAADCDLVARMLSMGRTHRTMAMTVAISTAMAAAIEGSVAHDVVPSSLPRRGTIRIGHPAGVLPIGIDLRREPDGSWRAASATTFRTARRIMDGFVYVPESYLQGTAWFQRQQVSAGQRS